MKRKVIKVIILIIITLIIRICMCYLIIFALANHKTNTIQETERHFSDYVEQLYTYFKQYDFDLTFEEQKYNGRIYKRNLLISIDDVSSIEINLRGEGSENDISERFVVRYYFKDHTNDYRFNIQLFVDIVNIISGIKITKDYCVEFLSPDGGYLENENHKADDDVIFKTDDIDFTYRLYYSLKIDNSEELVFVGDTDQGVFWITSV